MHKKIQDKSLQMIQVDEIGSIGERITKLVDYFCQGNKTAFGRAADIQSGVLAGIVGGRESKPGFEILQKLLTAYPSVEPTWLLFGRGPMLRGEVESNATESVATPSKDALEELVQQVVAAQLARSSSADDIHLRKILVASERFRLEDEQKELVGRIAEMEQEVKSANLPIEHIKVAQLEELKREARWNDGMLGYNTYEVGVLQRINTQTLPLEAQAVYRISGKPDVNQHFGGLLTHRLSITEEQARQLVLGKQIRATEIEGVGYRVTEKAVREFLGEA